MKQIIGTINFNTLCKKNSSSFICSRKFEWENHKAKILDKRNIDFRLNILINHSLPNLLNNIPYDVNFKLVILYSTLLPEQTINDLQKTRLDSNGIIVLESRNEEDYLDIKGSIARTIKQTNGDRKDENILFASFRLDDDDILSTKYLYEIKKYVKNENINHFISFSNGLECLWNDNIVEKLCFCKKSFLSLGLCHVGLFNAKTNSFLTDPETVYCGKSHFDIPHYFKTIVDDAPSMWIYSRHKYQDTHAKFQFNNNAKAEMSEYITESFPTIQSVFNRVSP